MFRDNSRRPGLDPRPCASSRAEPPNNNHNSIPVAARESLMVGILCAFLLCWHELTRAPAENFPHSHRTTQNGDNHHQRNHKWRVKFVLVLAVLFKSCHGFYWWWKVKLLNGTDWLAVRELWVEVAVIAFAPNFSNFLTFTFQNEWGLRFEWALCGIWNLQTIELRSKWLN